ncbi:MAG: hypothetical protein ACLTU3_14930, partial [Acutalibacteraceae bacterium]
TKSSVCSVRKSAKCDFFLNLMKKSLTFRLWSRHQKRVDQFNASHRKVMSKIIHCPSQAPSKLWSGKHSLKNDGIRQKRNKKI